MKMKKKTKTGMNWEKPTTAITNINILWSKGNKLNPVNTADVYSSMALSIVRVL